MTSKIFRKSRKKWENSEKIGSYAYNRLISTLMHRSELPLFFDNKWALFLTLISRQFLIVFLGNYTITKKEASMSDNLTLRRK